MQLRQFVLSDVVARFLSTFAYRKTDIAKATIGHKHSFFSLYLTKALNLRSEAGQTIEAVDDRRLILWIVPPGMFHEWVGDGTVWDLTPLHRPHKLAT